MSPRASAYDAFLSYSHDEATWVEDLAGRLQDECGFRIWLDRWVLVAGESWQQAMAKGLEGASTCVVCVGARTPHGWCEQEIERALDLQTKNPEFRVIPVLLPSANAEFVPAFLSLRTWADFREGHDAAYGFHVLRQGIRGEPVGRWPIGPPAIQSGTLKECEQKISELRHLHGFGLHDEVVIEYQRKILDHWWEGGGRKVKLS
jgi:hypothetical protein